MNGDPGPVIGRGRASLIYDLGDGTVLRRYLDSRQSSEPEAALMRLAARRGVPVPDVRSARGPDMRLDYVPGPTMLTILLEHPDRAADLGRLLMDLHRRMDGILSPTGDSSLVHGDLHPGNVIMSPEGPVLLDWTNARWAERSLDVATTWLVLACFQPSVRPSELDVDSVPRLQLLRAFLEVADCPATRGALPRAAEIRRLDAATTQLEITRMTALCATAR